MKKTTFKLTALVSAALLSACGGGGGGGTGSNTPAPNAANSVPIIYSVATPTYVRGSGEEAAFNYLNAERSRCDFGMVAQNTLLDKAARNHASYLRTNPADVTTNRHKETSGAPGFTGVSPQDRAKAVGYQETVGEVFAFDNSWRNLQYIAAGDFNLVPYNAIRELMTGPYHALQVFSSAVEVGQGTHMDVAIANGAQTMDAATGFEFGYGKAPDGQLPPAGSGIRTYPCEGTSNILPGFPGEWTGGAPVEGNRNIYSNPLGHPIMVVGEYGKTLELTSATITQVSTGADVGVYALRFKANDPNPSLLWNDWSGYVFPDKPFIPGQQYRATLNGKSGGVAFAAKTFTFSSGGGRVSY